MKSGLFAKKMFSYVVGFSNSEKEIIIIPLDSDGNPGDDLLLKKENIISEKYGLQGDIKIKTNISKDEIRFVVPPYTPTTLESSYILPIVQEDNASKFRDFVKQNF